MAEPITTALGSIKAAYEVAKSLIGVRDAVVIQGKVAELLGQIAAAQEGTLRSQEREFTLTRQVHELEQRIVKLEAWDAEKQRYQLTDFGGGTFAYDLKPDMSSGEPSHRICAACYQEGRKSILQFKLQTGYHQDKYNCPACGKDFLFGVRHSPPMPERAISDYDPFE